MFKSELQQLSLIVSLEKNILRGSKGLRGAPWYHEERRIPLQLSNGLQKNKHFVRGSVCLF